MQQNELDLESGIIDLDELMRMTPQQLRELRAKERPCPDVKFDRRNLELKVHHGKACYEIDLERCNDPAQILDFIFQINAKTWATSDLIGQIVEALNEACREVFGDGIQGIFCPWGESRQANWRRNEKSPLS
ncbi:MAG: hypothetical protein ACLQBD_01985 [Syntrophobacteraceae bacterium]